MGDFTTARVSLKRLAITVIFPSLQIGNLGLEELLVVYRYHVAGTKSFDPFFLTVLPLAVRQVVRGRERQTKMPRSSL